MHSILLIDDKRELLDELAVNLRQNLLNDEVQIRTWAPSKDEAADPFAKFNELIDADTVLVVTDYDLTARGLTGLFGTSVVAWCHARALPVGDYSRANVNALPHEPDLFELRVPTQPDTAAAFVASVFRGFRWIRRELSARPETLRAKQSPASVLAALLEVSDLETQFALYNVRLGGAHGALFDLIAKTAPQDLEPTIDEKLRLLAYIIGHMLLNSVLRFPGPIVSVQALAAYGGVAKSEAESVALFFDGAKYSGPFSELERFFWLARIDDILRPLIEGLPGEFQAETHGELNREAVERSLGRRFARHACRRCNGLHGGFWCPFTGSVVCQRPDCSVGSNSWLPQGARICRIERDFYNEWAPILGI